MTRKLHAEQLVKELVDHYRFKSKKMKFYFYRVRSSGGVSGRDHKVPKCDPAAYKRFKRHVKAVSGKLYPGKRGGKRKQKRKSKGKSLQTA